MPWVTLLCCAVAGTAAWFSGRNAFKPASPPPPVPVVVVAAPAPVEKETRPAVPPPKPVLENLRSLAAAAAGEPDAIVRQQRLGGAARLLAEASAAEARELFLTTADPFLQECAVGRWAELEPQAALEHLLSLDPQQRTQLAAGFKSLCCALFQGWAHCDPEGALAAAEKVRLASWGFSEVVDAAACQAISEDVTRGLACCAKYPGLFMRLEAAFRAMWEHQPAAFTRGVFQMPAAFQMDTSLVRIAVEAAKTWAAADKAGFIAWAAEHFASASRETRCSGELFGLLLRNDPAAAGEVFARTPPSTLRNLMRQQYVAGMAAEDPQAAAEWIDANLTNGREAAYRTWAEAAAKSVGPEKAATMALSLPPGTGREAATSAALYAWAGEDFAAALKWSKMQPAEEGGPAPVTFLTHYWLQQNGTEAGRYILQHPDLGWGNSVFRLAALRVPVSEAVAVALDAPETAATTILKAIGEQLAEKNGTVKSIASLPVASQAVAVRVAASEMSYSNREKAAAWVAALPAGALRHAGEEGIKGAGNEKNNNSK